MDAFDLAQCRYFDRNGERIDPHEIDHLDEFWASRPGVDSRFRVIRSMPDEWAVERRGRVTRDGEDYVPLTARVGQPDYRHTPQSTLDSALYALVGEN